MRRKSERNKSKSAAEKKPAETTPRKARRSSRRRKRSSSHSSSEDSDDAPLKPAVVETQEVEVIPPSNEPKKSESRSNSDEDKQEEQPIWKVKTSEAPSGEIQKLKICLQRPPTTPERTEKSPRRRRGKASSQSDDASLTPEEKPQKRKTRRSSPITQVTEGSTVDNKLIEEAEKDECIIIVKETNEVMLGKGKLDCSQSQESENPECVQDSQAELQPVESLIESKIEQDMEQDSAPVTKDTDVTVEQKTVEQETLGETPVAEQMDVVEEIQKETAPDSEVQNVENTETQSADVQQVLETDQTVDQIKSDEKVDECTKPIQKEVVENIPESSNIENTETIVKTETVTESNEQQTPDEDVSTKNKELSETAVEETKTIKLEATVTENPEQPTKSLTEDSESSTNLVQKTEKEIEDSESKEGITVKTNPETDITEIKNIETIVVESSLKTETPEVSLKDVEMTEVSEDSKVDIKKEEEKPKSVNEVMVTSSNEESKSVINEDSKLLLKTEVENSTNDEINENSKTIDEDEKSLSNKECSQELKSSSTDESNVVLTDKSEVLNDKQNELSTEESISFSNEDIKPVSNEESKLNDETKLTLSDNTKSSLHEDTKSVSNEESENLAEDLKSSTNEEKMDDSPIGDKCYSDIKKVSEEENYKYKNPDPIISSNDEKKTDSPERIIRRRTWGKYCAPLINEQSITFSVISTFFPSLKILNVDEVKLENEEVIKEQKIVKKEREVIIQPFQSPKEEDSEKEVSNIGLNRKISIVNDDASKLQPPPSPAKNPISSILYITNLVRPFTIKQLQELLSRTGKIIQDGFWTDKIKSKCYVQYETEEEAEATRNALHGVQWPTGNGKKLIIDFGTLESMTAAKNAIEPPVVKSAQEKITEKVPEHKKEEPVEDERWDKARAAAPIREWDLGKVPQDQRDRSRSRDRNQVRTDRNDKKRPPRTESPSNGDHITPRKKKKEDTEVKMMDDLFHKTKATPSIYWLPLSPEQIAKKQQQRLQRMAEHKRRMEESRRMERDFGRGAPRSRRRSSRYDGD